jgi:hypothetical protein
MSGCASVSSVVSSSVLSSVVLLLAFFCDLDVLLESYVTYSTPLVITSKLSLFKFRCVDLFSVLHLLLHMSLDWKQAALQAPCAEGPHPIPIVISEMGQEA